MNFEIVTLSESSQAKMSTEYMNPFYIKPQNRQRGTNLQQQISGCMEIQAERCEGGFTKSTKKLLPPWVLSMFSLW